MNKEALSNLLQSNHAAFIADLSQLDDSAICYAPEGKWTAIQQLDHIVRAVKPVNMAMGVPKFILKWRFGMANRPSKTYEQLVEKYKRKLQEGGKASGPFVPAPIQADKRLPLIHELAGLVAALSRKTEKQSEEVLDKYILPHPLLGKLTLREMLYFTAYHVEHHQGLVRKGLENR